MDVLNAPLSHILKDTPLFEGHIQPSIAIRCPAQLVAFREDNPSIKVQAGKCALLKDYHVGWVQPEVLVLFKIFSGALLGVLTSHYVPGVGQVAGREQKKRKRGKGGSRGGEEGEREGAEEEKREKGSRGEERAMEGAEGEKRGEGGSRGGEEGGKEGAEGGRERAEGEGGSRGGKGESGGGKGREQRGKEGAEGGRERAEGGRERAEGGRERAEDELGSEGREQTGRKGRAWEWREYQMQYFALQLTVL